MNYKGAYTDNLFIVEKVCLGQATLSGWAEEE